MERKITLIVNYFTAGTEARSAEIDQCLIANAANPLIHKIVVISQTDQRPTALVDVPAGKVVWTELDCSANPYQRPTFRNYFDIINSLPSSPYDLSIIANADIVFDDSLALLLPYDLEGVCVALSRWDGAAVTVADNSQDVWIFQGRVRPVSGGANEIPLGIWGCDWRIAWELRWADYRLINPCLDIRALHRHQAPERHNGSALGGRTVRSIKHCHLAECNLRPVRKSKVGLIGFSVYGSDPRYTVGAVHNAILSRHLYPGWTLRFYVDETVPESVLVQLRHLKTEVVMMPKNTGISGMFWRFRVADDSGYERWMVRDADSRLNYRERRAVDEWIESGAPAHIMRDHPGQQRLIHSSFGAVNGVITDLGKSIDGWPHQSNYGNDEDFLQQVVWPRIKDTAMIHSSFSKSYGGNVKPFPTEREFGRFVGERCYHDEHWNGEDRDAIWTAESWRAEQSWNAP